VRVLLENKADPNIQDKYYGRTALIWASERGHAGIVKELLEHEADPNIQNKDGNTSLILASENDHTDIVKVLLQHGADPNTQACNGKKAFDVAENFGIKKLIENRIRWNRRKALMIILSENGYVLSPSSSCSSVSSGSLLRFENVFSNEGLLRLIVSYM